MGAKYVIDGETLVNIADAIRYQYDNDDDVLVDDMAELIENIEAGGGLNLPEKISITSKTLASDTDGVLSIPHGLGNKKADVAVVLYGGNRSRYAYVSSCSLGNYARVCNNDAITTSKSSVCQVTVDSVNVNVAENGTYHKKAGTYYCITISYD